MTGTVYAERAADPVFVLPEVRGAAWKIYINKVEFLREKSGRSPGITENYGTKKRGRRIEAVLIFKCVFVQRRNLWNLIGVWGYDTKTNSEI